MRIKDPNQSTRWILIIASFITVVLILWNTYTLITNIKTDERTKMELYAIAQREIQSATLDEDIGALPLEVVSSNTITPIIVVDEYKNGQIINFVNIDSEKAVARDSIYLKELLKDFAAQNNPIPIVFEDVVKWKMYYGDSELIRKLRFYPIALVLIILLFAGVIYFYYSTSKAADQNKLWAGMAKETAHQIGTPLSSLLGWLEFLRSEKVDDSIIEEMEKDVDRLSTITERFSKIGSLPELTPKDLVQETQKAYDYLKARSSKLIEYEFIYPEETIHVKLNPRLYGWTIENLVKNGIDAMKGKGTVTIEIQPHGKTVDILVTDKGKGIAKSYYKKIFDPGFTTKKRGWGLGLSLAKRIIEDYHQGRIRVKHSETNKGTTMQITLKVIP